MGMHLGLVRPSGKRVLVTERFGEGQVGEDLFFLPDFHFGTRPEWPECTIGPHTRPCVNEITVVFYSPIEIAHFCGGGAY